MPRMRREWIGARVAFPGYVMEGGPHRPDLITWIELPDSPRSSERGPY